MRSFSSNNGHSALARSLDIAGLIGAFGVAAAVASRMASAGMFIWPNHAPSDILGWPAQYVVLFLASLVLWGVIASKVGLYRSDYAARSPLNGVLWRAALLWTVAVGAALFLLKLSNVSRMFVLGFSLVGTIFVALRAHIECVVTRRIERGRQRIAVVIGRGVQTDWLLRYLSDNFSPHPYAMVSRFEAGDAECGVKDRDGHREAHAAWTPRYSEAFIAATDLSADTSRLIPQLLKRGVKLHVLPAVFDASIFRLDLTDIGGVPLVTVCNGELDAFEAAVKRAIDFVGSALLLMLASPIIALIALLVKMTSPGPVLFRQERLGKNGRRILVNKFRTMRCDAEDVLKSDKAMYGEYIRNNFKLPKGRDPRVTRVGRFLRETSLDELPQLINVLKGEMSLVGPRPVVPEEIEKYGEYATLVLAAKPGLTGQWQVSGRSDVADYEQRVRLDMEYLRDQSIGTDLRILMRTVPAVLLRQGAH